MNPGDAVCKQYLYKTFTMFPGGKPPKDSTTVMIKKLFVSTEAMIGVGLLAGTGILLALAFLAVNVIFRDTR